MKPRSTEAGPPVWKAPPELTNRPAPIAPPLRGVGQYRLGDSVVNITWQSFACVCLWDRGEVRCDRLPQSHDPPLGRHMAATHRWHACRRAHRFRFWHSSLRKRGRGMGRSERCKLKTAIYPSCKALKLTVPCITRPKSKPKLLTPSDMPNSESLISCCGVPARRG